MCSLLAPCYYCIRFDAMDASGRHRIGAPPIMAATWGYPSMAIQINTKPVVAPPAPVVRGNKADAPDTYATRIDKIDSHVVSYFNDATTAAMMAAHGALICTNYKSDQYRPLVDTLIAHLDQHGNFAGIITRDDARRQGVCVRHWIKLLTDCGNSGRNKDVPGLDKALRVALKGCRDSAFAYAAKAKRVQAALDMVVAGSVK